MSFSVLKSAKLSKDSIQRLAEGGGVQEIVEKHWAILGDALPRNFRANVRISVCNSPLIYSTWFLMLDASRDMEICKNDFETKDTRGGG